MTHKDFMALVLHATENTLDMLESTLRDEPPGELDTDNDADPATATVLLAADQLVFALVRYRAEHQIPQR
jgi:hypothetical protein